jgi:hypothetical protein
LSPASDSSPSFFSLFPGGEADTTTVYPANTFHSFLHYTTFLYSGVFTLTTIDFTLCFSSKQMGCFSCCPGDMQMLSLALDSLCSSAPVKGKRDVWSLSI